MALGEGDVDHEEDGRQPLPDLRPCGHPERHTRGSDLVLRPHQPLRHRRLGHEEGGGDLGGRQPAHRPQRQRHPCLGRQRRMAAHEHEGELVVPVARRRPGPPAVVPHRRRLLLAAPGLAPRHVDGPPAGDGHQPPGWVGREPALGPRRQGGDAGLLHRVLGGPEVAGGAGDRGHRRPPVPAQQRLDLDRQVRASTSTIGRTITEASVADGTVAAQRRASSRSAQSTMA